MAYLTFQTKIAFFLNKKAVFKINFDLLFIKLLESHGFD